MLKILDFERFAAVMCLDRNHDCEPITGPEPFRGQPDLELQLPYSEYLEFLQCLPSDHNMLFKSPSDALLDPLKSYYIDMAFAIGKELYFCSQHTMKCTRISHQFHAGQTLPMPPLNYKQFEDIYRTAMKMRSFDIGTISPTNMPVYRYAVTLFGCGHIGVTKQYNFPIK